MKKIVERAAPERSAELRRLLTTLAHRTTEEHTLTALAKKIGTTKYTMSYWIRVGEVHPWKAAEMLKLEGANPNKEEKITLEKLTPSLF